jgi:hypothetical protein
VDSSARHPRGVDGGPMPARDCLLDDALHLTAEEAVRLATALLKAAEDIQGNGTHLPPL